MYISYLSRSNWCFWNLCVVFHEGLILLVCVKHVWWDQSRALPYLHYWDLGGCRPRNLWVSSVVWAVLLQSVKAVGVCGCAEEEGSPKGIAPELQPPRIRNILKFKFQLQDLMSLLLPLCIHLKFSSVNLDKISLLGVWLLTFLNSHCAFPPLKNGLGKLGFFFFFSHFFLSVVVIVSFFRKKKKKQWWKQENSLVFLIA